jgi:hypothetical protein
LFAESARSIFGLAQIKRLPCRPIRSKPRP